MSFALVSYLGGSTGGIWPTGSHLSDGETLLTLFAAPRLLAVALTAVLGTGELRPGDSPRDLGGEACGGSPGVLLCISVQSPAPSQ